VGGEHVIAVLSRDENPEATKRALVRFLDSLT